MLLGPKADQLVLGKQNWEKVTSDPWVLQTVQGYSQELITAPTRSFLPGQVIFARMARGTREGGDKSLLEKGAIERVRVPQHHQWISLMFLVPKKDRSATPVFNLKGMNQFLHWEHFEMENIQIIRDLF